MKKSCSMAIILMTFTCLTQAKNKISVSHLSSYNAEFDYYVQQENGELIKAGHWTDKLTISDAQVIRTVKRFPTGGSSDLIRTVAADKINLSPAWINQRFGPNLDSVYYSELMEHKLSQIFLANSEVPAKTSTDDFADSVLETNLQGVFAAALPFSTESEISVTSYIGGAVPQTRQLTFTVAGQEELQVLGQKTKAWKVHDAAGNWTYWVRKEAPYLVKVSHPAPDGSILVSLLTRFESQ